jgi:hypothetical protein
MRKGKMRGFIDEMDAEDPKWFQKQLKDMMKRPKNENMRDM